MKVVLSLGAGVQSSCMALMAEHGEIPKPEFAVFADVGAEPREVYEWLEYLKTKLSYPVITVMHKDGLTADLEVAAKGATRCSNPPFFTESDSGGGMLRRKCTADFKVAAIHRHLRKWMGFTKGQRIPNEGVRVRQMLGISLDEIQRMKISMDSWQELIYPLVEKRMTRWDCLRWMQDHGYPEPPRSACVYCPYKSDSEWRRLRDDDPEGWAEAVRIDNMIRDGFSGSKERCFTHRSLKPLSEVDLSTDEDRGQMSLWNAECEGMCGL